MNKKIHRHTWGLREALFEEWEALRRGDIPPSRALASAKVAAVILQSVEVEMAYTKQVNNAKSGDVLPIAREIRLGAA
jgi:hypothetical protein